MTIEFTYPTVEIPRDRWGRPLIVPIGGGKPVGYTRVSTLAKALDDKTALTKWKQRQVVIGLGARPDLVAVAGAVKNDDRKLDEIVETAMTAAESERAANIGTALHALSEQVDADCAHRKGRTCVARGADEGKTPRNGARLRGPPAPG
jgi:hypothetical protein